MRPTGLRARPLPHAPKPIMDRVIVRWASARGARHPLIAPQAPQPTLQLGSFRWATKLAALVTNKPQRGRLIVRVYAD
jgi:hypothetical protein